jgi:hypothetical protein
MYSRNQVSDTESHGGQIANREPVARSASTGPSSTATRA